MDMYREAYSVDAWSRDMSETGPKGMPWPENVDTEGAGIVYWVMEDELKGAVEDRDMVSVSGYEEFWDSIIGGARELEIPFMPLTAENIAAVAEPAGAAVS